MEKINKSIGLIKRNEHILKIAGSDPVRSKALMLKLILSEVYYVEITLDDAIFILEVI